MVLPLLTEATVAFSFASCIPAQMMKSNMAPCPWHSMPQHPDYLYRVHLICCGWRSTCPSFSMKLRVGTQPISAIGALWHFGVGSAFGETRARDATSEPSFQATHMPQKPVFLQNPLIGRCLTQSILRSSLLTAWTLVIERWRHHCHFQTVVPRHQSVVRVWSSNPLWLNLPVMVLVATKLQACWMIPSAHPLSMAILQPHLLRTVVPPQLLRTVSARRPQKVSTVPYLLEAAVLFHP